MKVELSGSSASLKSIIIEKYR